MRSQQRKWTKQKQQQRRLRERRQQLHEQGVCDDVMIQAQLAWQALLSRVVNPGNSDQGRFRTRVSDLVQRPPHR